MSDRRLELELAAKSSADAIFAATQNRVHELVREVEQANQAFKNGAMGPQLYAVRMGQMRTEATKLAQGTRSLVGRDLQGLDDVLARTSGTTTKTTGSMRELKSGLAGLAFQLTGTAGPAGKLAEGLAMLGGGTPLVLGIAAGLSIIALGINAITKEQREAKKATGEAITALLQLREASRGKGAVQAEQEALAREHLKDVTKKLADTERDLLITRNLLTSPASAAQSDANAMRLTQLEREREKLLEDQRRTLMAVNAPELARQRERYNEQQKLLNDTFTKLNVQYSEAIVRLGLLRARTDDQGAAIQRLRFQQQGLTGAALDTAMQTWKATQAIERQIEAMQRRNAEIVKAESTLEGAKLFRRFMQMGMDAGSAAGLTLELQRSMQMIKDQEERANAHPRLRGVPQTKEEIKALQPVALEPMPGSEEKLSGVQRVLEGIGDGIQRTLLGLTDIELMLATDLVAASEHFGAALGGSFVNAISAGKNLGKALKQATMSSLADIARSKAKYYAAEALAALAGAFFPKFNPSGLFAFAKYTAAAAAMGAIAGGLSGGGGGGGGGGSGGGTADQGRSSTEGGGIRDMRPIVNLYIVGQNGEQLVKTVLYGSQRYQQLGGKPPNSGTVAVQLPGAVMLPAGG